KHASTITSFAICVIVFICILSVPVFARQKADLSDPEIASVAVTANQVDIGYAAVAKEKSKNAEVLKFADMMTNDHTSVINQAVALAKLLNVTPKDNAVSKKLMADV